MPKLSFPSNFVFQGSRTSQDWPTESSRGESDHAGAGCTWPSFLDLFNREVVGWSIQPRMTADLVAEALIMATGRRQRVDREGGVRGRPPPR